MMSGHQIVFIQSGSPSTPVSPQSPQPAHPTTGIPIRDEIRNQIRQSIEDATRAATEARDAQREIRDAQQHLRDAERQLRDARTPDQRAAAEAAIFGAQTELGALQGSHAMGVTVQPAMLPNDMIPRQAVDISIAFFIMFAAIIIGWPIARAFGRRLERRGESPAAIDPALTSQLQRIEQAVEAMSIEIERISESQRFMAKLQSGASTESPALGSGERR